MENQIDDMNMRLGNVEATMEQILQLLLELNERSRWRQGRPLGRRDHRNNEGEWSDSSTLSRDSRSQPRLTDGSNYQRFYGVKEGTHLNKSE
jgi:hypothetical protein